MTEANAVISTLLDILISFSPCRALLLLSHCAYIAMAIENDRKTSFDARSNFIQRKHVYDLIGIRCK